MTAWAGHKIVVGRTGSGKTYHVVHSLMPACQGGIFFFNLAQLPGSYFYSDALHVTGNDSIRAVRAALTKGRTVIYAPSLKQKIADQELAVWQQELMADERRVTVVVDEVQRTAPQGSVDTACHIMATGGRSRGLECVFVTQRIADVSKTIVTQCQTWIIFDHSSIDADYLRSRGVVLTDFEQKTLKEVPYSHYTKSV